MSPVPVLAREKPTVTVSPGSMAPLPVPQPSVMIVEPAGTTFGTGASTPLYTTSAKSWSRAPPEPGTPSELMLEAETVTVKLPEAPPGRKTLSTLSR